MTENAHVTIGRLEVAASLEEFVRTELAPGTGIDPDLFWDDFGAIVDDLDPRSRALLATRDDLQAQIDAWHVARRGQPHDRAAYEAFLREIGYLAPEPHGVRVATANVDPEIAEMAGPQLVVPADNARYALNAANARWGSLYDALYGTDVIPTEGGAGRDGPYNAVRGDRVIAFARDLLDRHAPLTAGSHADAVAYRVTAGALAVELAGGSAAGLAPGAHLAGYTGDPNDPDSVLLRRNGLGIEIIVDRDHPIGAVDRAGVADIGLEAALTTIMDLEDSVATVDASDKVLAYRNWLGLMKGDLAASFTKGGRTITRELRADSPYLDADGKPHDAAAPQRHAGAQHPGRTSRPASSASTGHRSSRPCWTPPSVPGARCTIRRAPGRIATAPPARCTSSSPRCTDPTRSLWPASCSAVSRTPSAWTATPSRSASWTRSAAPRSTWLRASPRPPSG